MLIPLLTFSALSSVSDAAEFSADMIIEKEGLKTRVYVKGEKLRQEHSAAGMKSITIIRPDKKVMWNIMPEEKMYMEMPLTGKETMNDPRMQQHMQERAEKKYLGEENVNGYLCEKYKYIYYDKSKGSTTVWLAKKLNFAIKVVTQGKNGAVSLEYKNIKEQKLPDSLFELPAGYKKVSMPVMPEMPR